VESVLHISDAAKLLGITPEHLRTLERQGRIPSARRDFNGRIYSPSDIALLRSMGVGARPKRLRTIEEVVDDSR
jgi:DNA-binding transcriptional MerR regulator